MSSPTVSSPLLETCSICLEDVPPMEISNQQKIKHLDCAHLFHKACIEEWIKQKPSCPLCRAPVEGEEKAVEERGATGPLSLEEMFDIQERLHHVVRAIEHLGETDQRVRSFALSRLLSQT